MAPEQTEENASGMGVAAAKKVFRGVAIAAVAMRCTDTRNEGRKEKTLSKRLSQYCTKTTMCMRRKRGDLQATSNADQRRKVLACVMLGKALDYASCLSL